MSEHQDEQKQEPGPVAAPTGELRPQLIKLALELGPLVLFFLANARGRSVLEQYPALAAYFPQPIFFATAVFMVAMAISLTVSLILLKKLPIMPLVTGVVVLVFGGMTLWLQDETFIKIKPTIVNLLFAGVLLSGLMFGKTLLKYVFGEVYKLEEKGWLILTWRWGLFFVFLAIVNEVVWRSFDTDTWVAFKVWGVLPITLVFSFWQIPVLNRYGIKPPEEDNTG
ncbi:MAG: septation protein A [Alphaproteobacteria bacterium]|nr:septation protein A [Alphaproteobacteria bacterium]